LAQPKNERHFQEKQKPRNEKSPHRIDVLKRIKAQTPGIARGGIAKFHSDPPMRILVNHDGEHGGYQPDGDLEKNGGIERIHRRILRRKT
jgi:hypothetical protein